MSRRARRSNASVCALSEPHEDLNVGGAVRRFDLLPIAVCQSIVYLLTHRYREQAPSHIGSMVYLKPQINSSTNCKQ